MAMAVWDFDELVRAAAGVADGAPAGPLTGFSIDTRSLAAGEVFVALEDQRDGHEFVGNAFKAGAAAALVAETYEKKSGDGALIRVAEPLRALEGIGRAARARLSSEACVIAVTGSVGKTGTKEMLRACLARLGETHAADKSFNNHWGVPLTLARMPASARFGVFEIGMNHAGEITPLTSMVQPHAAIVTTVEPVHLEFFPSVEAIAEAKAEIFTGLVTGGAAILNRDNPHFELLRSRAAAAGARIVAFGRHADADVRLRASTLGAEGSEVEVSVGNGIVRYRLGAPGAHLVQNSLAVVAALSSIGADVETAVAALGDVQAAEGRGARAELAVVGGYVLIIDESYNANPASMRSALAAMATVPRSRFPRRIAVLGDMRELGKDAPRLHAELKEAVDAAGADLVFASGPHMAHLVSALGPSRTAAWSDAAAGIEAALLTTVTAGDVVMIKGSLGSKMAPLVGALKSKLTAAAGG
ncbi:MAG: UDP-N-acetylmuramoylalanyl-D-glutamyl-2,6-diaminopimelate--D-alanyl-D-alanine ligase [Hyphomicrobium sp.]